MTAADRVVSIVVMNHNHGAFLARAIDSALAQTHHSTQVVVVDDASSDDSRAIIAGYGDRIVPVLLDENRGQAGAFTAALAHITGDPVCSLDADDALLPSAAAMAARLAQSDPGAVKLHWPLIGIRADDTPTGFRYPARELPDGSLLDLVLREGPGAYPTPPTSGNAWSCAFLQRVLPAPEDLVLGLDAYLFGLAPLFGTVRACQEPQGFYRFHDSSGYNSLAFDDRLAMSLGHDEVVIREVARWCVELGHRADPERWLADSWYGRLRRAVARLQELIPPRTSFALVDDGQWHLDGNDIRRPIPFPSRNGVYWGPPADSHAARQELERVCAEGVAFLVFAWPAFWWFDHYREFTDWVLSRFHCVLRDELLVVFDLSTSEPMPTAPRSGS